MTLRRPENSGLLILNITGVGPEKATINMTEIATSDGGIFNSGRLPPRNIVMSLRFFEVFNTVEELRHESYKYFPIKSPVTLTFETEERTAEINGYVEANEPVIFSKECFTQLSVICPDPFFYSDKKQVTLFSGVIPMFEFPFSNESLTEKLLIMGEIWPEATRSVWYEGDADVGVIIHILAKGPISGLQIYDDTTERKMTINDGRLTELTGSTLIEGDRVIISTVRGDKHIALIRDGIEYNILNALNRDSFWFQLRKGDNIFAYTATYGLANLDFRIENRIAFEGV